MTQKKTPAIAGCLNCCCLSLEKSLVARSPTRQPSSLRDLIRIVTEDTVIL